MSANDYIEAVKKKNASLFTEPSGVIKIRKDKLLELMKSSFEHGMRIGRANEKAAKSIFEQIFGGR